MQHIAHPSRSRSCELIDCTYSVWYIPFRSGTNLSLCSGPILLVSSFLRLIGFSGADLQFEWYRFGTGYGNMIHLANVYISPWDTPFLCGIIAAVVQCFFAYRIWTLQRDYWWLCLLIVLVRIYQWDNLDICQC